MCIRYAILSIVFLVIPALAQAEDVSVEDMGNKVMEELEEIFGKIEERYEMFLLGQPCGGKIGLMVENLDEDAEEISLTKESIEITVRSRLRSAKIYDALSGPYLYVRVHVVGAAVNVQIDFIQSVTKPPIIDLETEQEVYPQTTFSTPTWDTASTGTHGYDAGNILEFIAQHTDEFIDEYLRVNEKVCELSR